MSLVVALVVVDFVVVVVCCVRGGGGLMVNLVFSSYPGVGSGVGWLLYSGLLSSLGKAEEEVGEHRVALVNCEVGGDGVKVGNAVQKDAHLRFDEGYTISINLARSAL